jgi:hypothetical protein
VGHTKVRCRAPIREEATDGGFGHAVEADEASNAYVGELNGGFGENQEHANGSATNAEATNGGDDW